MKKLFGFLYFFTFCLVILLILQGNAFGQSYTYHTFPNGKRTQVVALSDSTGEFVSITDLLTNPNFMLQVALGKVPGALIVNKFGHNPTIATNTDPEDVWAGSGIYDFYPTATQSMEAVSSSSEDGVGGTGALIIQVYGLSGTWALQNESVTLNGSSTVNLSNTYTRVFRTIVTSAGTNNTNVGNITVRIKGAGTTGSYIMAGDGQTQQAIYTIPINYTGFFLKGYVGISKGGGATVVAAEFKWKAKANNGVNGAWATKGQMECITHGSSWWQYEYGAPNGPIPEKTDIRIECVEVSATVGVVGGLDLILFDNTIWDL